jgi:hypothetical protein
MARLAQRLTEAITGNVNQARVAHRHPGRVLPERPHRAKVIGDTAIS